MKTERSIVCGKHLREIRNYMGLTQEEFGIRLGEWGITGKDKESVGRSAEVVASWESGRNQVPNKILKAVMDNVLFEGEKIQWAYLTGDSEFITQGVAGIVHHTFNQMNEISNSASEMVPISFEELLTDPATKFGNLLFDELLPFYEIDRSEIFDVTRFYKYMKDNIHELIIAYIQNEKSGS